MPKTPRYSERRGISCPRISATPAVILFITGVFHAYRGEPIESVIFCAAGIVVVADGAGWLPPPWILRPFLPGPVQSVLIAVPAAMVVGALELRGSVETVVLSALGAGILLLAWCQADSPAPVRTPKIRVTAWSWALVGLSLCLAQLVVYLLSDPPLREDEYPTLTHLVEPVIDQGGGVAHGFVDVVDCPRVRPGEMESRRSPSK